MPELIDQDAPTVTTWNWVNVALRGLLETAIVAGLAYWGYQAAHGAWRFALAIAAPIIGFGIWGAVDVRQAGRWSEVLRCTEELAISAVVALGLALIGAGVAAAILMCLSVVYHISVYAAGERLLDRAGTSST
jgi:hypothetical protein